jgi:hypothetical protein
MVGKGPAYDGRTSTEPADGSGESGRFVAVATCDPARPTNKSPLRRWPCRQALPISACADALLLDRRGQGQ